MRGKTRRKLKHLALSAESSDGERNKAVVLLDVSLQDVRAGTKDSLEPRSVQFHTLQRSTGEDSGSAGSVHQQGDLA